MIIGAFILWLLAAVLAVVAGFVPDRRLIPFAFAAFIVGWMIQLGYHSAHPFTFN